LSTLHFADDQVIITTSEDSVQKLLHQLSTTASAYNLTICASKTKVLAVKGRELRKAKIRFDYLCQ
jgi:hypothetical protein